MTSTTPITRGPRKKKAPTTCHPPQSLQSAQPSTSFQPDFPTPTGQSWNRSGFRERVWVKAVKAALKGEESDSDRPTVFEGFTFHLLRHTACSLMASAGMDPAVAAERAGHTDGGALFLRTYRHLYEAEKRTQALRLEEKILADLATIWTDGEGEAGNRLNEAGNGDGRT